LPQSVIARLKAVATYFFAYMTKEAGAEKTIAMFLRVFVVKYS